MKAGHLSKTMVVAGLLSIAIGGCGNTGGNGPSNSQGGVTADGGASGAGGATGAGGSAAGGTTGSGGSSVPAATGGATGSGGAATGGAKATGGAVGSGGHVASSGGGVGNGGVQAGGAVGSTGGTGTGTGIRGTGGAAGGSTGTITPTNTVTNTATKTNTGTGTGTCTASVATGKNVSGSGPHKVVMESNAGAGIKCGTIYRPADLGTEKYPIFVWGEGGCSQSGTSNQAAMAEIASHGYFIVADGVASGTACTGGQDGKAMLDYITWAIAENDKSCSAYYQSLDTTKVAADGFSCGGLMAENVSGDPRFTTVGITSSGLFSADQNLYKKIHTPFKILLGGSGDMAYTNGERDYDQISALGIPILLLSKDGAGHGGDLNNGKGDFNTVNLAWLNWQLKGDTGATGKGLLMGSSCKYCTASGWEYKSKNIP
jgi:hypothetical protein